MSRSGLRWSDVAMAAFVLAVILAGLLGPWMISLALAAAAGLTYAARRGGSHGAR